MEKAVQEKRSEEDRFRRTGLDERSEPRESGKRLNLICNPIEPKDGGKKGDSLLSFLPPLLTMLPSFSSSYSVLAAKTGP
jgi:hypothetical protein